jgi:hypothetical protein
MINRNNDNNDDKDHALRWSRLWEDEGATRDQDTRMMWRAKTRNTIEARIFELRSVCGGRHIHRVP